MNEALVEKGDLHSYSVYVESVSEGSVLVVLRIPPSCTGLVRTAITPDFARVHHLTEVTVDGVDLPISWDEREMLVCYHLLPSIYLSMTLPNSPLQVVLSTYCSVCL